MSSRKSKKEDPLKKLFDFLEAGDLAAAREELKRGFEEAQAEGQKELQALYLSFEGLLSKASNNAKEAWRFYEKAEKFMPEDPALTILVAKLLVEVFSESDSALKKMKKVLEKEGENPFYFHHATIVQGLAYLKKGDKKQAVECLARSVKNDFRGLSGVEQIDFTLFEALIRKKVGLSEAYVYAEKALQLAQEKKQKNYIDKLQALLKIWKSVLPQPLQFH